MKRTLIYLSILFAPVALSQQTTEYTLSKAVNVGCAQGMADLGKKVTIERTDATVKFTLVNLVCSKTYEGTLKIDFGSGATGYLDTKNKKGIVIDGQTVSLFNEESGNYQVVIAGHEDKKEAKSISTEAQQSKYEAVFNRFDALLAQAKKEAEKAEMAANTLPLPTISLEDEYGISGLYYFSEPVSISSNTREIDRKTVEAVYLYMDKADNYVLKAYFTNEKFDKFYFDGARMFKAFKEGRAKEIGLMKADNMNDVKVLRSSIDKLEDGLFIVNYGIWFGTKSGCSEPERRGATQAELDNKTKQYILLGKDKNRMQALLNNLPELERLAGESAVKQCKIQDALEAAEKPMPAASAMNTGTLKSEATILTKEFAKGRWAQEVEYAFITGKEWYTLRNKITGIITGRAISAVAVMKDKDGSCRWEEISIRQDYNGTDYGKSYFGGESSIIVPVDCSTAMKYK